MNRKFQSMILVVAALIVTASASNQAQAGDGHLAHGQQYYSKYDKYNFDNYDRHYEFMQYGLSHGRQWGHGTVARSAAQLEDAICPSRVNGYLTKTHYGPFTTIR